MTPIRPALLALLLLSAHGRALAQVPPSVDPARESLARSFSTLVRQAIPEVYDKRDDWGDTKEIFAGLRTEGKGFKTRLKRRKKAVNHGVWKHYKLRLVEPKKNLTVRVDRLRPLDAGRVGFQLHVSTTLDAWARAKVYQYGVHLIALEVVGDMRIELTLDCEVGIRVEQAEGGAAAVLDPQVKKAHLNLADFKLHRVSNAHGPLVDELGDAIRHQVKRELTSEKLTAKLNRAIDKKRDRLQMSWSDLLQSDWWPMAAVPSEAAGLR